MKDVAQYTRVTPNQRIAALRTYLENVRNSPESQKLLRDWGLRIDSREVEFKGRQLENELICFGRGVTTQPPNADWNRAVGEHRVTGPIDMYNWILFYTKKDDKYAKDFAQNMTRLGGVMGCKINPPTHVMLRDDMNATYMQACREHINKNTQVRIFFTLTSCQINF